MEKGKKVIATLLLIILLYATLFSGLVAYADSPVAGFEINEAGELRALATGSELVIPSVVQGVTVKKIVEVRSLPSVTITSVELPNTVEEIGEAVFQGSNYGTPTNGRLMLQSINIPESVKVIGKNAFRYNNITSLIVPSSVREVGYGAFANNSITELTVSAKKIGDGAFSQNSITSLTLVNGVKEIGEGAFSTNNITSLTIPNSVEKIGISAFTGNNISSVTIPDSVKEIGTAAFYENSITSLKLSKAMTEVSYASFASNAIKNLEIPQGIKVIGKAAFADNELENLVIPNSVEEIGDYAFASNRNTYTDVIIPSSVKKIGIQIIGGTSRKNSVTILNPKAELNEEAFTETNLGKICGYKWSTAEAYATKNNITFEPLTNMEKDGIKYSINYDTKKLTITGITSRADIEKYWPHGLAIPEKIEIGTEKYTVIAIADEALKDLPVNKITVPSTIETIGNKAFANNKITGLVLPRKLKSIGNFAFENCIQLEWVYLSDSVETIGEALFKNNTQVVVYCHDNSLAKASALNAGRDVYEVDMVLEGEGPGDCAVDGICYRLNRANQTAVVSGLKNERTREIFGNLVNITIPSSIKVNNQTYEVRTVGANAINDQILENLTISEGVKSIEYKAFGDCSKLKQVDIPSSVIAIDIEAFKNCERLRVINIDEDGPYSYKNNILYRRNGGIDNYYLCGYLISNPDITVIENDVFEGVNTINANAFANLESLELIKIPETVINIDDNAFRSIKDRIVIQGYQESAAYNYADAKGIRFECIGIYKRKVSQYWGIQHYSFNNSGENFGDIYDIGFLRNYVSNNLWECSNGNYGEWRGSCFGMAVTAKLFLNGVLSRVAWHDQEDGERIAYDVYEFDKPVENQRLRYLINFYQIFQWVLCGHEEDGAIFTILLKDANALHLSAITDESRNEYYDERPLICNISSMAHAVIILGNIEELSEDFLNEHNSEFSDYAYRLEIYNPDSSYKEYIYIKKDLKTMTIGDINTPRKYYGEFTHVDLYKYDKDTAWSVESLINDDKKAAFDLNGIRLLTKTTKIKLFGWNDIYAKIEYFEKVDGDLDCDVEELALSNGTESNSEEESQSNTISKITLKDGDWYRVEAVDDTEPLDVSIIFKDSYMVAKTKAGGTATFENKKSVAITNPSGEEFETKLTLNDEFVTLPWYTITTSGKGATELKVEMTEEGAVISGDNLQDINVRGNNTDETIELNVSTKRNKILIKSDAEETKLVAYVDRDGDGIFETALDVIDEKNMAVDSDDDEIINVDDSKETTDNVQTKNITTEKNVQTGDKIGNIVICLATAIVVLMITGCAKFIRYKRK